jgi:predicted enzyme related to lactoylglutathione lyase
MKKVTGIGGIFFKCDDTQSVMAWYKTHLGLDTTEYGTNFTWRKEEDPDQKGYTLWAPFKKDTTYFEPSQKEFMINFRVADIEGLVKELKEGGVTVLDEIQAYPYGKFVHILDPEGNKIELWEPDDEAYGKMGESEQEDSGG